MKRSAKIGFGVGVGVVCIGIAWFVTHRAPPIRPAEPQKTVQEILQERATQAGKHLETPLGKAFAEKNWVEFQKIYQPATQFNELAEILRAAFIQNTFQNFTAADTEMTLSLVTTTFEQLDKKTEPLANLLVTQFFRLPAPEKKSPTYEKLLGWANSNSQINDFKKRNGLLKIFLQDLNPPASVVQTYLAGILSNTDRMDHNEWIRKMDDVRSVPTQKKCVEYLSQHYAKLDQANRPAALLVLSRHPEIETTSLVKYTIDAYQKDSQDYFEAALRATKPLLDRKAFNEKQKAGIENKLSTIPESFLTPFVRAKRAEIQRVLTKN